MTAVALYFVASPLQYLSARHIARHHEAKARQILVWYQAGITSLIDPNEWDASSYMPPPRMEPLPGPMGRHRRLQSNLRLVADLVGRCDVLHIHSAVFDAETINYFLQALPRQVGARSMRARILPDGLISIRRYPLSATKRLLQWPRKLRRLISPELDYWRFSGDRIGSDAPFCDRIYVLPHLPHAYPPDKVVTLPPLVSEGGAEARQRSELCALVIGQPMVGAGLMGASERDQVTHEMQTWLTAHGFARVHYKGHPKDSHQELCAPGYEVLSLNEPIESWMSRHHYDAVIGTRSTALLFAGQLYGPDTPVLAFGWEHTRFKSEAEKRDMAHAFSQSGVKLMPPAAPRPHTLPSL